jgi:hypothetical protein
VLKKLGVFFSGNPNSEGFEENFLKTKRKSISRNQRRI